MEDVLSESERGARLNWRQACDILGCGKDFFYRLVNDGTLPAYRAQGSRRGLWVYETDCHSLVKRIGRPCPTDGAKS
ncbi:MAG: excisionase family DNA-binding protein [Desulfovibrio sp.]|nr:excisionase family DNA-binding protein [Desulfovibrio sp.]